MIRNVTTLHRLLGRNTPDQPEPAPPAPDTAMAADADASADADAGPGPGEGTERPAAAGNAAAGAAGVEERFGNPAQARCDEPRLPERGMAVRRGGGTAQRGSGRHARGGPATGVTGLTGVPEARDASASGRRRRTELEEVAAAWDLACERARKTAAALSAAYRAHPDVLSVTADGDRAVVALRVGDVRAWHIWRGTVGIRDEDVALHEDACVGIGRCDGVPVQMVGYGVPALLEAAAAEARLPYRLWDQVYDLAAVYQDTTGTRWRCTDTVAVDGVPLLMADGRDELCRMTSVVRQAGPLVPAVPPMAAPAGDGTGTGSGEGAGARVLSLTDALPADAEAAGEERSGADSSGEERPGAGEGSAPCSAAEEGELSRPSRPSAAEEPPGSEESPAYGPEAATDAADAGAPEGAEAPGAAEAAGGPWQP